VFTPDFVRGFEKPWEGNGVGEFCVDIILCWGDWIEGGKGK